jgi:hypothetical protein
VPRGMWVRVKEPVKFSTSEKAKIIEIISNYMEEYCLLKKRITKTVIKAGRVYFYEKLGEKDIELAFVRITIYDKNCDECTTEYKRYNEQWFALYKANLKNCINYIAENEESFY